VFLLKDSSKTETILTQNLQVQLNQKLKMMMQKMCKMMHIVVQVEKKMLPSNKSMMMLMKMIMISKKHQYQIVHQQLRDYVPNTRYASDQYVVLLSDGSEPDCFSEAMKYENKKEWNKAIQEEMDSLHKNYAYELVKLPKGKKVRKNKWVYKNKQEEHTSHPRYKARLVVKGFSQRKGIDFDEIFSPMVKMTSIRMILGVAASLNLEVEQMDVKTTFLHRELAEEIYMEQPEGFSFRDFYFRALRSLVVLSFSQLVSFSSVLSKPLSKTLRRSSDGRIPVSLTV
jgi:hypothetical protein